MFHLVKGLPLRHFHSPRTLAGRRHCSVLSAALKFKPGTTLHGYTVDKVTPVDELQCVSVSLTHKGTGAQHLHIARDDPNNVFSVALRTTPRDSTGVPHILEHTVLCGSQRYPVRDPFFKMLTRSMATFMNAMTSNDWTMYPFSTMNEKDFGHLMSVYLDAVFFPRLKELDFMQEGWRLEHEDVADASSPLTFKGIVFNEMKGVFSSSASTYYVNLQNKLLPSHTYSVISGGDPLVIPDLTWGKLRDFHAQYYHPSNSRFYTYGNLPLEKHLEKIDKTTLSRFSKLNLDTSVPSEPRWQEPRSAEITCGPDPMVTDFNKQTTVSQTYLLSDVTELYESMCLSIVAYLLQTGDSSPLATALLEPNIGSDFPPIVGYMNNARDSCFSVGLQGIADEDRDRVLQIIEDTLDDVIRDGFPQERIDGILHKIELDLKHQTADFGLHLLMSTIHGWIHDTDMSELLQISRPLERLKADLEADPAFLQNLVTKYFKDNRHKLTLTMRPDEEQASKLAQVEAELLRSKVDALTPQEKTRVYEKGLELEEAQNKKDDLSCLPSLHLGDLGVRGDWAHTEDFDAAGVPVQLCVQPTNGVSYFRAVASAADLDPQLLPFLPLFANVITKSVAVSCLSLSSTVM